MIRTYGSGLSGKKKCSLFREGALLCMLLVLVSAATGGSASVPDTGASPKDMQQEEEKREKEWGVQILSMRLSAGGYLLDFRYRVTDAEKASPLFRRKVKPYLVDQASGARFAVPEPPKVGALRSMRKPESGRNYFMIFANPGKYIKKGSKVTVVMDAFRSENIVVE